MSEPRFLSLRWRLMVPLLAVWLGSMVLAVAVLYLGILDRFQGLVGQHARMMATAVQSAAETAREPEDLHRFVAALGASRDMEKVVLVAGAPPRILASSDHRLSGQLPEHLGDTDLVGQLSRALEERKGWQRVDPAGLRLDLLEPVLLLTAASTGGRLEAGALYLRMDASPLWQAAKEIVVQLSLWLGGILTALASLIYLLLSRFVLTPAEGLRQALLDRKEGLVTVSLPAPRRDELGELALTLDSLLGNLEGRNQEVARMTRLYQALSATNQAIVHCEGPASLLSEVCRIAVEQGQLDLAWIGFVDPETGGLLPVAVHRQGGVSDPAALHCFLGREGVPAAPQVFNDVRTTPLAPACLRCSEHMLDGAFAVFPIRGDEGPDGALVLSKSEAGFFDGQTVALLEEMSADIAFALRNYRREERLHLTARVFENNSEGIVVIDRGRRVVMINRAFTQLTGYPEGDVKGRPLSLIDPDRNPRGFAGEMRAVVAQGRAWKGEVWVRRVDGSAFPAEFSVNGVPGPDGQLTHSVLVFSDVSQRKEDEARIRFLASHDFLTGLPSRVSLEDKFAAARDRVRHEGGRLALCFLDLDRFKNVNDTLGHPSGDQLLVEVAHRLEAVLAEGDAALRHGGDEFVVLMPVPEGRSEQVSRIGRLLRALDEPFHLSGCEFSLSSSIGVAVWPDDGGSAEALLNRADMAMYRAKEEGRNTMAFFADGMLAPPSERLSLEHALRRAVERDELRLHYQPLVSAADGRLVGAEALLRWSHPELGPVSPGRFIPLAEESGLILPISDRVLEMACAQIADWVRDGHQPVPVAINLSALQFRRSDFVDSVAAALERHGVPARLLVLEVTESMVMRDVEQAARQLAELKALGLSLAVDDFGTGYSSLAYLKRFSLDKLKIDQSFVREINAGPEDRAIVTAIVGLGRNLGMELVAEGVETELVASTLRGLGCDHLQGWLYGKAVPPDEFAAGWLAARQPA